MNKCPTYIGCKRRFHTATICSTVQEDATKTVDVNVHGLGVEIDTYVCEAVKTAGKLSDPIYGCAVACEMGDES